MWHVTVAEIFTADNNEQPVALIRRGEGGTYTIEVQPDRVLPSSSLPYPPGGVFASFDDALNYGLGN
jgi:hypothetical protein